MGESPQRLSYEAISTLRQEGESLIRFATSAANRNVSQESLGFRFSIEHQHLPQCRSRESRALVQLLDNPLYADVVFVIHGKGEHVSHIFACEAILTETSTYFELRKRLSLLR